MQSKNDEDCPEHMGWDKKHFKVKCAILDKKPNVDKIHQNKQKEVF